MSNQRFLGGPQILRFRSPTLRVCASNTRFTAAQGIHDTVCGTYYSVLIGHCLGHFRLERPCAVLVLSQVCERLLSSVVTSASSVNATCLPLLPTTLLCFGLDLCLQSCYNTYISTRWLLHPLVHGPVLQSLHHIASHSSSQRLDWEQRKLFSYRGTVKYPQHLLNG